MLARAEVEKQRKENLRQARAAKAARQARGDSSDDDIEIISSNVNLFCIHAMVFTEDIDLR
jgi:hypothetical protein